jgi:hypothetical protein
MVLVRQVQHGFHTAWYRSIHSYSNRVGSIFGAAKTFRDMPNVNWYKDSKTAGSSKKILRIVLANLLLIPSWILVIYSDALLEALQAVGLNDLILTSTHFFILYYLGFGILPKHLFARLDLIETRLSRTLIPDSGSEQDPEDKDEI